MSPNSAFPPVAPPARPGRRAPRPGRSRRVLVPLAPAVVCLLALAGCGGGGTAEPGVASLPSTAASSAASPAGSAPSTKAIATRTGSAAPQERLDDTPAEREALIHAWDECLVAHGARWTTTRAAIAGAPKSVADPVPKKASAACEDKLPQEPPELNPALNTHYRDDTLAEIACLRKHGVLVHLVPDTSVDPGGLGWTYDSSMTEVPANEGEIEDTCQMEAFGGGAGK